MNYIYQEVSRYSKVVSVLALNLGRNTTSFLIDGQKGIIKEFFNTTGLGTNICLACSHDSHGSLARSLSRPLTKLCSFFADVL